MTADEFFETIEKNTEYEDIALCAGINCLDCFVKEDFASPRANGCYRYFIKYLIEENQRLKKEIMKSNYTLKRHEYALLSSLENIEMKRMKDVRVLNAYRRWGYFDGVDENALIEDVMDRCEVIDDD